MGVRINLAFGARRKLASRPTDSVQIGRISAVLQRAAHRISSLNGRLASFLNISVQLLAGIEIIAILGFGFTMIQVEEYAAAVFLWVLFALGLVARVVDSDLRPTLKVICPILSIFASLILISWTNIKRRDNDWSSLSAPLHRRLYPAEIANQPLIEYHVIPPSRPSFWSNKTILPLVSSAKAQPPQQPSRSIEDKPQVQSIPTPRIARLGVGPDAYKDIDDAQVGQWAIVESEKIEELAQVAQRSGPPSISAREFFFRTDFNECCVQDMQELRSEILRRLGPLAKDPDEISAWQMLFPQTAVPGFPSPINTTLVSIYAPYLRRLGVRLKHRQIPRVAPKALHFSQANTDPNYLNMPYNIVITIKTETTVSTGYVIVEFDGQPGTITCDFLDAKLLFGSDAKTIDNDDVREYLVQYQPPKYALAIGKTALIPEKPIHVFASGGGAPFHATKITLFDE